MKKLIVLFTLITLIACHQQSESAQHYDYANETKTTYAEAEETSLQSLNEGNGQQKEQEGTQNLTERRIIKTANFQFEVKTLENSTNNISEAIKHYSGFITNSNQHSSPYRLTQNMTIRVPADSFEKALNDLEQESVYTNYKRINSRDVSEEFFDIQTRLKTKKEVRDRYIDILRNKAKTVEDILMAEEKIRILQEEIEAKEGRLKFLKNQTSLSTIHLEIYQQIAYSPQQVTYEKSFLQKIKAAFLSGWTLTINLFLGLLNIWPLLLVLIFVIWKRRWLFGRFRRKT